MCAANGGWKLKKMLLRKLEFYNLQLKSVHYWDIVGCILSLWRCVSLVQLQEQMNLNSLWLRLMGIVIFRSVRHAKVTHNKIFPKQSWNNWNQCKPIWSLHYPIGVLCFHVEQHWRHQWKGNWEYRMVKNTCGTSGPSHFTTVRRSVEEEHFSWDYYI